MKKLSIIAFAIAAALSSTANAAHEVANGTLQFKGNLTAASCAIRASGGSAGQGGDILVDMGTVSFADLGTSNDAGVLTDLDLVIDCDNTNEWGIVTLTFDPSSGSGIDRESDLLKLAAGGATGAAIAIYENGDLVDMSHNPELSAEVSESGTATISLAAAYVLNGDVQKPGVANASLPFVLTYE